MQKAGEMNMRVVYGHGENDVLLYFAFNKRHTSVREGIMVMLRTMSYMTLHPTSGTNWHERGPWS